MSIRENIFQEVDAEREYQDQKWGGAPHDDKHNSHDWVAFMNAYLGRAVHGNGWQFDPEMFRENMIKVAAIAVAAVEWVDRNTF